MKKLLMVMLVGSLLSFGAVANASVSYDFSGYITPVDIATTPSNDQGVGIAYFLGTNASITASGIIGDALAGNGGGEIVLTFAQPSSNLHLAFNFYNETILDTSIAGSLEATFSPALTTNTYTPTTGVSYAGEFSVVDLYFAAPDGYPNFNITNITYDPTTVPEPSTYALLVISLGVVGYARKRMTSKQV